MKKSIFKMVTLCLSAFAFAMTACSGNGGGYYYDGGTNMEYFVAAPDDDNYQYEKIEERGFVQTAETPSSYFSLDRNTAGYAFMRAQIKNQQKIAADSVRLEEYVNYFSYDYPAPTLGEGVNATAYLSPCPWNEEHKLMTVGIKTEQAYLETEGGNYVFLVDVSGSMSGSVACQENDIYSRMDLVKYSIRTIVDGLSENDSVAIVTYASGVKTNLDATRVTDFNRYFIDRAINKLSTGGSTNGAGGIERAYDIAKKSFRTGGNNRVVLMSDGDFNVGTTDLDALKELVQERAKSGVYLSVLGVGMGNTRDDLMQTLALNGNGNYAYLDSTMEAQKVLKEELNGTMYTVAKDAKAGVTFNADMVSSYRLLGYDMKRMSQSDFENQEKDAGEIGSNLTVTAMYEIELAEGATENTSLAEVHVKWKNIQDQSKEKKISVLNTENGTNDTAFAACVAEFALVLRESQYAANASLEKVMARLQGLNSYLQNDEYKKDFVQLVNKAIESEFYGLPTENESETA